MRAHLIAWTTFALFLYGMAEITTPEMPTLNDTPPEFYEAEAGVNMIQDKIQEDIPRLKVKGTQILDHEGKVWVGRGMNWGRHSVLTLYDDTDAAKMKKVFVSKTGTPWINHIRVVFKWVRGTMLDKKTKKQISYDGYDADAGDKGYLSEAIRTYIDNIVKWATEAKIWVTLTMTFNGGTDKSPKGTCTAFITDKTWRSQHQALWRYLVDTYKKTPYIAWVEPWSEAKMDNCSEKQASGWMNELIDEIQKADSHVPVAIGSHYNMCSAPKYWHKLKSDQVIYPINFWCPGVTTMNPAAAYGKEDTCKAAWGGRNSPNRPCIAGCTDAEAGVRGTKARTTPSKKDYMTMVQSALDKAKTLNAPIWVDQWGCEDTRPGFMEWIQDVGKILVDRKVSTDWWSWKGDCAMCVLAPKYDCKKEWKSNGFKNLSDCRTNGKRMAAKPALTAALNGVLGEPPSSSSASAAP